MEETNSSDSAPVEVPVVKKAGNPAMWVGIILVATLSVVFIIVVVIAVLNSAAMLSKRAADIDYNQNNSSNTNGNNRQQPSSDMSTVTFGKMSYNTPKTWTELTYPGKSYGTDGSQLNNLRGDVITAGGTTVLGVFHQDTPAGSPVPGVERQKQKAQLSYDIMKGLSIERMLTARNMYGETQLACGKDFAYDDKGMTMVTDTVTGKYGIEYGFTCLTASDRKIIGFHGSYYDSDDTLHSFDIVGLETNWNNHKDEIAKIRDSIKLQ